MKFFNLSRKRVFTSFMALAFLGSVLFGFAPVSAQSSSDSYQNTSQGQEQVNLIAQATPTPTPTPNPPPEEYSEYVDQVTCERVGGFGWLVCPILEWIYGTLDWLSHEIVGENLLNVDTENFKQGSPQGEEMLKVWRFFLSIANLLFVLAFMAIIYAMAIGPSSIIEAYSIRRMLPRLVFAVVMAYLSAIIFTVAVDISNDFGQGISQLMLSPVGGTADFNLGIEAFGDLTDGTAADTGGSILDGLLEASVLFYGVALFIALGNIFTIGLWALLGIAVVLVVLLLRYLFLVLLFITAPIAFVSFVLPKTGKFFDFWWETFWKLLVMYPLIMMFLASGRLAGKIISAGAGDNFLIATLGIIVTFLPYFVIPLTFRLAGTAVTTLTRGLQNISGRMRDQQNPYSMGARAKRRDIDRERAMRLGENRAINLPRHVRSGLNRFKAKSTETLRAERIEQGQKIIGSIVTTQADDLVTAAALTGGGKYKGVRVSTADGDSRWSSRLMNNMYYMRDENGNIQTDEIYGGNGAAMIYDGYQVRAASSGDFYSHELMSGVKSKANDYGFMMGAYAHTGKTIKYAEDMSRIAQGLNASNFSKGEKIGVMKGLGPQNLRDMLHLKALKVGEMQNRPVTTPTGLPNKIEYDPLKLFQNASIESTYGLMNQRPVFWEPMRGGVREMRQILDGTHSSTSFSDPADAARFRKHIKGVALRAHGFVDGVRRGGAIPELDDEGERTGQYIQPSAYASQTSSTSAVEAEKFYREVKELFPEMDLPDLN